MRFAFLPVLGFSTEDLVGLGLLVLLQFLHVTLLISVCFIKVALREKIWNYTQERVTYLKY